MKKLLALLMAVTMIVMVAGCTAPTPAPAATEAPAAATEAPAATQAPAPADKVYKIATVVKLTGVAWFDRMEEGVNQFAADTGMDAWQTGHSTADPAEQVRIIDDLIAQGVDAICVVPNSTESLEAVLKKAMDAGIVVIAHEASNIQNANYDIEAFDNTEYGKHFMGMLGEMMGGKGQYTTFVGSLTATSHNEWVDGSTAVQAEKYPDMELVSNKNESTENIDNAYNKTLELLKAYPNLVGFQGSAMTDVVGVGKAIDEMGKQDSTVVIGTSLVSVAGQYLETGAIDKISFWDPAKAGYAMNELALMILKGETPSDGMSLQAEGYQNLKLVGKVFYGSAWIDVDKSNMGDYSF